jgi:predicted alpha/beta-hydrolase family hydrolase
VGADRVDGVVGAVSYPVFPPGVPARIRTDSQPGYGLRSLWFRFTTVGRRLIREMPRGHY